MSPAVEARARGTSDPEQSPKPQLGYLGKGVMLEPFIHQVGGHCCVLRFGEQTICKPLIDREQQFYLSLPPPIREFTPQYKGVVSVSFEDDEDGNLCLIAYPLHSEQENKDNDNHVPEGCWPNAQTDHDLSPASIQRGATGEELEWLKQAEVLSYRLERSLPQHNPWSLKCHQRHLQALKKNAQQFNQYRCLLLENLTWRQAVPCVLDLKMGTRVHGDDATEEKRAVQTAKCQQSTSASIGMRLGGMQVYRSDTDQLMFMNKYHGFALTVPGFKEAMLQFFHDRGELLSPVLRRLRELQAALEACESYRFYSSSLLIIYDGELHTHRRRRSEHGLSEEEEEDRGEEEGTDELEEDGDDEEVDVMGAGAAARGRGRSRPGPSDPEPPEVDVRMIDFAHTTCRDFTGDRVVHEGQDSGFIFGLKNLISIISELPELSAD